MLFTDGQFFWLTSCHIFKRKCTARKQLFTYYLQSFIRINRDLQLFLTSQCANISNNISDVYMQFKPPLLWKYVVGGYFSILNLFFSLVLNSLLLLLKYNINARNDTPHSLCILFTHDESLLGFLLFLQWAQLSIFPERKVTEKRGKTKAISCPLCLPCLFHPNYGHGTK